MLIHFCTKMVSEPVPETYWKEIAEQRRLALNDTLEENKSVNMDAGNWLDKSMFWRFLLMLSCSFFFSCDVPAWPRLLRSKHIKKVKKNVSY